MQEEIKKKSRYEVYDLETLRAAFTYTGIDIATKEVFQFVLHPSRFDLDALIAHLEEIKYGIGYNNIMFDYPVLDFILKNYDYWRENARIDGGKYSENLIKFIIDSIYKRAQDIIQEQNFDYGDRKYNIREKNFLIKQIDLFKMWHFDNKAKLTSLKALEISINFHNVEDMPISHSKETLTLEELKYVISYNFNDVEATLELYKKSTDKLKLRQAVQKKYGLPCLSWNNGKIGEELILKLYCDKTGENPWDIKKLRTYRPSIKLNQCIPNIVSFKDKKFQDVLNYFRDKEITQTKNAFKLKVFYKGVKIVYGSGGIHGCTSSGIYSSDKYYVIKTCDVASLYPSLPIALRFTIQHLGKTFLDVYENDIVKVRLAEKAKPKAEQDKAIIDGYKEAANIPYGKSNEINSYLYDPLYTMQTTISGQLLLSMLTEQLSTIPDSQVLMVNTDGLEIRIPRNQEELYQKICKDWEAQTKLVLEYDEYERMWIRDVNSYGSMTTSGKIKNKGAFEVDKKLGNEPAYHKDNSFRIIPLALQEFFAHGIPIESTIKKHFTNTYKDNINFGIYDFCGREKFADSVGELNKFIDNKLKKTKVSKNFRFFVSNEGWTLIKQYKKGTSEFIHKNWKVTPFNRFEERTSNEYNINYQFYIKECHKILGILQPNQLDMFK
jgi:hypothetical protein